MRSSQTIFLLEVIKTLDKETLENTKRCLVESGNRKRIFDHFPCLLPREDISQFETKFSEILSDIPVTISLNLDNELVLHHKLSQLQLMSWEKGIIKLAAEALLDTNRGIKQEILDLLGWENQLNSAEIHDIICAYVGAVNQVVIGANANTTYQSALAIACGYITKNYGQWVDDVLNRPTLSRLSDNKGMAIGLTAGAAIVGLTLFSMVATGQSSNVVNSFTPKV